DFVGRHLDLAGLQIRIDQLRIAPAHLAPDSDHELGADILGLAVGAGVPLGIEDDLRHPLPIPEIDEHELSMVPAPVHPSRQRHFTAFVEGPQHSTTVRSHPFPPEYPPVSSPPGPPRRRRRSESTPLR